LRTGPYMQYLIAFSVCYIIVETFGRRKQLRFGGVLHGKWRYPAEIICAVKIPGQTGECQNGKELLMFEEKNGSRLIDEDELKQVSGGVRAEPDRFTEAFCPKCGCITVAFQLGERLYACLTCRLTHNGEQIIG